MSGSRIKPAGASATRPRKLACVAATNGGRDKAQNAQETGSSSCAFLRLTLTDGWHSDSTSFTVLKKMSAGCVAEGGCDSINTTAVELRMSEWPIL